MDYLLAFGLGIAAATFVLLVLVRKRVEISTDQAMLLFRKGEPAKVLFHDHTVSPFWDSVEIIDLPIQALEWSFQGKSSIRCKDHLRAEIKVVLFFHVPREEEAILQLAHEMSTRRLQDPQELWKLIDAPLKEVIHVVLAERDYSQWENNPDKLKETLLEQLELPFNGLELKKISIPNFGPCPESNYKDSDLGDFQALLKIRKSKLDLGQMQQDIEDAEAFLLESKEKQREMMKKMIELQRIRGDLEQHQQKLEADSERFRSEVQVQLDILRSDLDMRIGDFRKFAAQQAAARGLTTPKGLEDEISRLRNRKRAESDLMRADNERIAVVLQKRIDKFPRS